MSKLIKNKLAQPFVKWAGGKRQLLSVIRNFIPHNIGRYYEPFVGGGAVLFDIQPSKAIINDFNSELMNVYEVIKNHPEELIEDLKTHQNSEEYFYRIRELDRCEDFKELPDLKKASRIIYLNKTCFNGLFRVNSQGQFNVPFGNYKEPNIVNEITIKAVSNYLNDADVTFLSVDFADSLNGIKKNDFVYFDPPYDPISEISSFTGYTLNGFGRDEQQRLKEACDKLNKKGIRFLMSNSATSFITELYKGYKIEIIQAIRSINSVADRRGKIDEVLIRNF